MRLVLLFCGLWLTGALLAQESNYAILSDTWSPSTGVTIIPVAKENVFDFQKASQSEIVQRKTVKGIPSMDHLPSLFCKLEYKLETKSKLAPRFRLGSLYYTEWMEGKRDCYMRYYK